MGHKWYSKKIMKFISRNNASKLESFLQRNAIDVNDQHFRHRNSMLHLACEKGSDIIVRYLLECGADPMTRNKRGQVPLHLACYYALEDSHQYAETDLILPLIKGCPSSLDAVDSEGVTPRMLAASIKNRLREQYEKNTEEEEDSDEEEEDEKEEEEEADLSDVGKSSWFNKLAEEAQNEFDDGSGSYMFDEFSEEEYETFDDWLDRIAKERYAKYTKNSFTQPSYSQGAASTTSENYDIPKISDEKKRSFEKKMADAQKELQHGLQERRRLHLSQSKITYEHNCDKLFKQKCSTAKAVTNLSVAGAKVKTPDSVHGALLRFDDIPWPHASGCDLESVEQFLFGDLEKGSAEYRSYLRLQQVRWHPDRFLHRCDARLVAAHRQRILEKVKALSQLLNRLTQDTRQ